MDTETAIPWAEYKFRSRRIHVFYLSPRRAGEHFHPLGYTNGSYQ